MKNNNIDIEKTPWLYEDYLNQFVNGRKDVYSEFTRLLNLDKHFSYEFLSKIFEMACKNWM